VSNSKHTPGPWVIQDNAAHGIHIYSNGGPFGGGLHVARVSNSAGIGYDGQEANARLIAAAPDMLAALEAYDAAMSSCWGDIDGLPPGNPDAARCWLLARAALAKARGE
jgi:hypothetical protein